MKRVSINGKFYAGGMTGVHRVADRLIRELDALLHEQASPSIEMQLICTLDSDWVPPLRAITVLRDTNAPSQRWEQLRLPRLASGSVLLNLANLAPLMHRNQILLIHDMQFLMKDSGYPLRQRVGYRYLVPHMAKASRKVLTVSTYSRQMLDFMNVSPADRTSVLYNGADHLPYDLANSASREEGSPRPYVLMFASPKAYKNNEVVFRAFERSEMDAFDLVLVGAAPEDMAKAGLTVPPATRFAGKCGDEELVKLYGNAHCFVFPSRTEGFGLPPVEAMLSSCPVVASPGGAIPEICRDTVLYADVDDAESWATAIASLCDESLRQSKIAKGHARAADFTWRKAGQSLFNQITALTDHA